jgi:hypothetical protein
MKKASAIIILNEIWNAQLKIGGTKLAPPIDEHVE